MRCSFFRLATVCWVVCQRSDRVTLPESSFGGMKISWSLDESATVVEGPGSPLVAELIVIGIYYRWWSSCVRLQAVA